MNKKRTWTALAALGGLCLFLPPVLRLLGCRVFPEQSDLLLVWAGAALLGASAGVLRRLGRMAGDPSYMRKLRAESDERYQAIRDRAGYLAGGLSLFLMLALGMVFLAFGSLGVPRWVVWLLMGIAVCYGLTVWALYRWLQRKM